MKRLLLAALVLCCSASCERKTEKNQIQERAFDAEEDADDEVAEESDIELTPYHATQTLNQRTVQQPGEKINQNPVRQTGQKLNQNPIENPKPEYNIERNRIPNSNQR